VYRIALGEEQLFSSSYVQEEGGRPTEVQNGKVPADIQWIVTIEEAEYLRECDTKTLMYGILG